MQWVGQETMYDLRKEIFEHLQRLPMSFFDRSPVGRLVTRATTDVDALNDLFASGVVAMLNDVVMLIGHGGLALRTESAAGAGDAFAAAVHDPGDLFFSKLGARRKPTHPHRDRADQLLPAGTHQRNGRGAAFQPRGEIAQAVRRTEQDSHGGIQGRDRRVLVLLSGCRVSQHGGHRAALLGRRCARDQRDSGNWVADVVHDLRAAVLPADPGFERKVQHPADRHGRFGAHLSAAR